MKLHMVKVMVSDADVCADDMRKVLPSATKDTPLILVT